MPVQRDEPSAPPQAENDLHQRIVRPVPAQRDEPSAPPQAENDLCQWIVVALRATGRLVPAFRRGMRLPYRQNGYGCGWCALK